MVTSGVGTHLGGPGDDEAMKDKGGGVRCRDIGVCVCVCVKVQGQVDTGEIAVHWRG